MLHVALWLALALFRGGYLTLPLILEPTVDVQRSEGVLGGIVGVAALYLERDKIPSKVPEPSRLEESRWTKKRAPNRGVANVLSRMMELECFEIVLERVTDDDAPLNELSNCAPDLVKLRCALVHVSL